jgi:cobalt-zinc-cadmium efflux system protein
MGHSHAHDHHHGFHHAESGRRGLVRALVLTGGFMVVEFIGGWWANSLALIGDAVHMLTDTGAIAFSLIAFQIAQRPTNSKMTYGYHRAEILSALMSGMAVVFLAALLFREAVERFQDPPEVAGQVVLGIAVVGLLINLFNLYFLHNHGGNLNVRAAYLHVLGDSLGSVAAIASGAVIWMTGWKLIDPIMTLIVGVLILWNAWHLIREAVEILMEGTPRGIDVDHLRTALEEIPSVQEVHDLHVWCLASDRNAMSAHLVSSEANETLVKANDILRNQFNIKHTTIQIEDPEHEYRDHDFCC